MCVHPEYEYCKKKLICYEERMRRFFPVISRVLLVKLGKYNLLEQPLHQVVHRVIVLHPLQPPAAAD
jgi:hypothetical protein